MLLEQRQCHLFPIKITLPLPDTVTGREVRTAELAVHQSPPNVIQDQANRMTSAAVDLVEVTYPCVLESADI